MLRIWHESCPPPSRMHADLVLSYPMPGHPQGWSDDLTDFHEEVCQGHHPIDLASIRVAVEHCLECCHNSGSARILEIGCSSGFLLRRLRRELPKAEVCGADIIDVPLKRLAEALRNEGLPTPLLQFDLTTCPLPDECFDVVVALNVLEHIEDDLRAAKEIHRLLKPGGAFIFEVPAGSSLYDDYDRELHHYRRYDAGSLDGLLVESGLKRKKLSHLGAFMYPAFWLVKKWRSRAQIAPEVNLKAGDHPSDLTRRLIKSSSGFLFKGLFAMELGLGNLINWPFGIRCMGVYTKEKAEE